MPFLRLYIDDQLQDQWELHAPGRLTIGRAPDNDIVLPHGTVSKHHVRIEAQGHDFVLVDDESANGVFVNGQRVTRHVLAFRDEIEIRPYRLLFMPLAKLPGEADGMDTLSNPGPLAQGTIMYKPGDMTALLEQVKHKQAPGLVREDSGERHDLDKLLFTLGRAPDSDLRCGGWFAPRLAATIQRHGTEHYLVPGPRGRVLLNGNRVRETARLTGGDRLEIQGTRFAYHAS